MLNKSKFIFCICLVVKVFIFDSFIFETAQGIPLSIIREKFNKTSTIEDFDENKGKEQQVLTLTRSLGDSAQLWTGGIVYYEFEAKFPRVQENKIRIAMTAIQSSTCIKFQPKTSTQRRDYITYRLAASDDGRKGCFSRVGRVGNPQDVVLTINACDDGTNYAGSAAHEIMHALGFKHEFQRGDRETYVTFHRENVKGTEQSINTNYASRPQDNTLGIEFNYKSIMQYDPRAGASRPGLYVFTNKQVAGRTKPLGEFSNMGQECSISAGDRRIIDSAYKVECGLKTVTKYTQDHMIPGTNCREKLMPMNDMVQ